jgi:hypothetical protein
MRLKQSPAILAATVAAICSSAARSDPASDAYAKAYAQEMKSCLDIEAHVERLGGFLPGSRTNDPEKIEGCRMRARRWAQIQLESQIKSDKFAKCLAWLDYLYIGMPEAAVSAVASWRGKCSPMSHFNNTVTALGTRKQLVIQENEAIVIGYLYFENDKLVAIQLRR